MSSIWRTMKRDEPECANQRSAVAAWLASQHSNPSAQLPKLTRREFLAGSALLALAAAVSGCKTTVEGAGYEPIIDIHQHLGYSGRSDEVLLAHQRAMGGVLATEKPDLLAFLGAEEVSQQPQRGQRRSGFSVAST